MRQHYSHSEKVVIHSEDEPVTEQSHAPFLEIKNMVKSGAMHFTDAKPFYAHADDLPDLEQIQINRLRINQVHANLHPKVRKHLRTADEMMRFLQSNPTHEDLVAVGLAEEILETPAPVETPVETPAE